MCGLLTHDFGECLNHQNDNNHNDDNDDGSKDDDRNMPNGFHSPERTSNWRQNQMLIKG